MIFLQNNPGDVVVISLYAVLGLSEKASDEEIEAASSRLLANLQSAGVQHDEISRKQASRCVAAIESARRILKNSQSKNDYLKQKATENAQAVGETHPRLGQLCVASGIITIEQLMEAVKSQLSSGLQLGEVLQQKQFISQAELDGLLLGQQMIDIPSAVTEADAARLISLGLITEDMGLIVQMESKTQGTSTRELVQRHAWVDKLVLDAVLN